MIVWLCVHVFVFFFFLVGEEVPLFYYYSLLSILTLQISDIRERHYEKMGIGSSYLFRLDDGYVVSESTL